MPQVEREIIQAEERLVRAMLESDVSTLDALIDDRLLFVGPDGNVYSKQDDLALHSSGEERIGRLDVEQRLVEAHDSVAAVVVVAAMEGVFKGQAFAGRFRYLRTWLRTPSGWRIIAGSVIGLGV